MVLADSEEMVLVLADPALHRYVGGCPDDLAGLRRRYERQLVGWSPDGSQRWLNWTVRRRKDRVAVGYVQATLEPRGRVAAVAWVVGTAFQRRGYGAEAVEAVVGLLREDGGPWRIVARIHPETRPSQALARRVGLAPTEEMLDGEVVWVLGAPA